MENDRLKLSTHPHVKKMGMKALLEWGVTAPPSYQEEVEEQLADLLGKETALLFPYPYPITLAGTVFIDKRYNPEWIDGSFYEVEKLPALLATSQEPKWVVTSSSFHGVTPVVTTYGAQLVVDDSSTFGVAGKLGMGLSAHRKEVSIIFGKTPFGTYLGLSRLLKKLLCDQNPHLSKAATLSAPLLGALSGALELIPDMELERERLEPLGETALSMNAPTTLSQV